MHHKPYIQAPYRNLSDNVCLLKRPLKCTLSNLKTSAQVYDHISIPFPLAKPFHFLLFAGNNTNREAGDEVKPNPLRTNFLCCSFYNIFARLKQY